MMVQIKHATIHKNISNGCISVLFCNTAISGGDVLQVGMQESRKITMSSFTTQELPLNSLTASDFELLVE